MSTFGEAVEKMMVGHKAWREGWNGKNMFLFIVAGNSWEFEADISGIDGLDTMPFICMKTADDKLIPWLSSQADSLADDWCFD